MDTNMSRGKNASKVANRERVMTEREAPLRRRISELERLVEKLDKANLDQQATHLTETQRMRALIADNTSERLEAALLELTKVRRTLEISETARRVGAGSINRLGGALQDAYEAAGMKAVDAREATLRVTKYLMSHINDDVPGFVKVDDINTTAGMIGATAKGLFEPSADPEEVIKMHRLQRAKGLRS